MAVSSASDKVVLTEKRHVLPEEAAGGGVDEQAACVVVLDEFVLIEHDPLFEVETGSSGLYLGLTVAERQVLQTAR